MIPSVGRATRQKSSCQTSETSDWCYNSAVARSRQVVVVLLLICVCCYVAEAFDTWDNTPQTGNDIEFNVVLIVLCIGIALVSFRLLLSPGRRLRRATVASFSPRLQDSQRESADILLPGERLCTLRI
jgi:hypothetical protein